MKEKELQEIHSSLINGQREQMVRLIDEYQPYDFFADYRDFLHNISMTPTFCMEKFEDAVISYFRIKEREGM